MKKRSIIIFTILIANLLLSGYTIFQAKPWPVPAVSAKKVNTVKTNPASISSGKQIWYEQCSSCHGRTGLGDGKIASMLKTSLSNFSTEAFQSQTDGSIFYKISEGREDMPSFKKKITNQKEIWDLVNFIRTLKQ